MNPCPLGRLKKIEEFDKLYLSLKHRPSVVIKESENRGSQDRMGKISWGVDHEKDRQVSSMKNNEDLFGPIQEFNEKLQESMENSRKLSEQMQTMLDEIKNRPTIVITKPTPYLSL